MDKKMTSGEIAKKAGISQKTVRLYDEKGLLKPSDYSEGNYRLYDKEALFVLEKIMALKQVGFSLEEIRDHLAQDEDKDIFTTLKDQLDMLNKRKAEIEKTITCIQNAITRCDGKADWDTIAEIMWSIQKDQGADTRHMDALKHTIDPVDWYEKIYESLNIRAGMNVLDLGCGYSKLWRNNFDKIPDNLKVYGYDLHGSWAEDFEKYLEEHKGALKQGTDIQVIYEDVEEQATWDSINKQGPYSLVVAHYVGSFLKDIETFFKNASAVLKEDGMFSFNTYSSDDELSFWQEVFENAGINASFAKEYAKTIYKKYEDGKAVLSKYFSRIEEVKLLNTFRYTDLNELIDRVYRRYPYHKKNITDAEVKLREYFESILQKNGEVIIKSSSIFSHCYK